MKLTTINTGYFKLDGGAMFGVVPKSLWSRLNPADENNLCTWSARCLLVEYGEKKVLIDTGLGKKQDKRFRSHFQPHGTETLLGSILSAGISTEDITDVIITHFHFDHIGGACQYDSNGNIVPTFPNATYWTNELHYKWADNPNPRERASFLKENFVPLKEHGVLQYVDVEEEVVFDDHISFRFYDGHTEKLMVPFIKVSNNKTLVYPADLLPSVHHIKLPYVMAYDVRPLITMKERKEFYDIVTDDRYTLFFEHDKDTECGKIGINEKGRYFLKEKFNLSDFTS